VAEATQSATSRGRGGTWVSLRRACEILGADESTLRRWADAGRLRVYRTPGGHRRFSLNDLESMVSGDGRHRGAEEVERVAVAKIRRQLQRARQDDNGWYGTLSDENRQRLRDLGRRLVEMAGEYMEKRTRRSSLLDEALEIGGEYGRVLIEAGLPLPNAVGAYIGFRKTIDETTNQAALRESMPLEEALAAAGQVHALGDQVLLGMTAAYEIATRNGG
jgi:excisionase family DNA binding protein